MLIDTRIYDEPFLLSKIINNAKLTDKEIETLMEKFKIRS